MTSPRNTVRESDVMKAVTDLLAAKKIFTLRMNAGDRFGETNGRKWRIKGHTPGTADLLAIVQYGECIEWRELFSPTATRTAAFMPLWLELKAPGKKQSPEQKEFQKDVEARGMTYLLVDNVDTLINWLRERGL